MKLQVARGFKQGTRIQSIVVPPELRVKHRTGIEFLDRALGGEGFTPSSTVMLTGDPGAGKSTLLRQLANALTKLGHIVVLNSGEETLYQVRLSCERLRLKEDFMVGEDTMLPKQLTFLDRVKAEHRGKQIFYLQDSLQTLDDGKYVDSKGNSRGTNGQTPLRCTEAIVDWAQRSFGVAVFICQVTKGGQFAGSNKIKHAIDAHAHIGYDRKPKSPTFGSILLNFSKNRWGCSGMTEILRMSDVGLEGLGPLHGGLPGELDDAAE